MSHVTVVLEICDEIETEQPIEFVGPQIELDLGEGSSIHDDLPAVEVPGVVPTVEIEEEDSSVELVISEREMKSDQAEGTRGEPIPEDAQVKEEGLVVGTGEPVPDARRSGEEPDLMEVDPTVRTGGEPVREKAAEAAGAVPDLGSGEDDLRFEDFSGETNLKRWENSHQRHHPKPHLLLAQNSLSTHPRALSRGRRGSKH